MHKRQPRGRFADPTILKRRVCGSAREEGLLPQTCAVAKFNTIGQAIRAIMPMTTYNYRSDIIYFFTEVAIVPCRP